MLSRTKEISAFALFLLVLSSLTLVAQEQRRKDLTDLSIEELMNVKVTLVSKRAQKLSSAAAAAFVITNEDLVRSGITSVPEVLRLVPGMQVAHIDANKWAITSRGFNSRFANKLLVLVDGRSVYTPLFSGVHWDVQDVPLYDVHQIEVIRGPGGALWGANAINGIINIITKEAKETSGGYFEGEFGSRSHRGGALRYGGALFDGMYYRAYVKGFAEGDYEASSTGEANDRWEMFKGGLRVDWEPSATSSVSFSSDLYRGLTHQTVTIPIATAPYVRTSKDVTKVQGGDILLRWNKTFDDRSKLLLAFYADRTERADLLHNEIRTSYDADVNYGFKLGTNHDIVLGAGFRTSSDQFVTRPTVAFNPARRTDHLVSAFLQDDIKLMQTLSITLGSKLERNSYTGFEFQPNVRLIWNPDSSWITWAAASRGVRTPSRAEVDVEVVLAAPAPGILVQVLGHDSFRSEVLTAYEAGIRFFHSTTHSIELSTFYNVYSSLRTVEPTSNPLVFLFDNKLKSRTYGVELNNSWLVTHGLKLSAGYSWFRSRFELVENSQDVSSGSETGGDSPQHQFHLRSFANIRSDWELDGLLFYVDRLPNQKIPSYWRLDARLSWHVSSMLTGTVGARNIFGARHPEFNTTPLGEWSSEVPRTVYAKVVWRF